MENKETPSLEKDVFVNIRPQYISTAQNCILPAKGKVGIKELSSHPSSTVHNAWHTCFPPPCQSSRYGWNDTHLSPFPLSVTDPLRKLSSFPYPAGPPLLPTQNRKRGRECRSTGENQREPRIVAIWGISGYNGPLRFLESQQGTGTLASFILHWAAPFPPRPTRT